ncbi:hypothetical protein HDE_01640 [Halotydeus destructor]|nr:hypothetical protein HDE_01640 [Halotydeus destructor]
MAINSEPVSPVLSTYCQEHLLTAKLTAVTLASPRMPTEVPLIVVASDLLVSSEGSPSMTPLSLDTREVSTVNISTSLRTPRKCDPSPPLQRDPGHAKRRLVF